MDLAKPINPPDDLALSRPLPPERFPRRISLRLSDGYETYAYVYPALQEPVARLPVLYLHGIQSHPGWFSGSAGALAQAGHAVYQVARRGSGQNQIARGHAHSAGLLLNDVQTACEFVLSQTGATRLHLLGVSWGGKLLTAYCVHPKRAVEVASLTLVAPGIAPRIDVPLREKLAVLAALLVAPMRRLDIPLSDVELFTDNPAMRQYLRQDSYRLHQATARFLLASRKLDIQLQRAKTGALTAATALLLATRDRIIDNAKTLSILHRLTAGKVKVRELDAAHTVEFEPDPTVFFGALLDALVEG